MQQDENCADMKLSWLGEINKMLLCYLDVYSFFIGIKDISHFCYE